MVYDFWGVPPPEPQAPGVVMSSLSADAHDPRNWTLIALRFPWLADVLPPPMFAAKSRGGNPGESGSQIETDLDRVRHLGAAASLADISEVLTGQRTYGGATYQRVKVVKQALKTSTTTPRQGSSSQKSQCKAA